MSIMGKKQVLWGKTEAVYSTDPVPVAGANGVLAYNIKCDPLVSQSADKGGMKGFLGANGKIISGTHVKFSFDVDACTSGLAGTAPPYSHILLACGHQLTTSAGVSNTYAPVDTNYGSNTFYFERGGKLRKILGWRGSMKLKMSKGGVPVFSFDGVGLYQEATDASLAGTVLTPYKPALPVESANTQATLFGYAAPISEITFDKGAPAIYDNKINKEAVVITDRKSTMSVVLEEPTMAQKNFEAIYRAGTYGAFSATHGTVAGSKLKQDAPNVQIVSYAESEQDGISMITLGLELIPTGSGNDYSLQYL